MNPRFGVWPAGWSDLGWRRFERSQARLCDKLRDVRPADFEIFFVPGAVAAAFIPLAGATAKQHSCRQQVV
jgi:hypothetical protein